MLSILLLLVSAASAIADDAVALGAGIAGKTLAPSTFEMDQRVWIRADQL